MGKVIVNIGDVYEFAKDKLDIQKNQISYINSGEFSSAFLLSTEAKKLIIRVNLNTDLGFRKDSFVYSTYPNIPTPSIIENGKFGESGYYSLSELLPGKQLTQFSSTESTLLFPSLFTVMNKIHTSDLTSDPLLNTENWKKTLQRYTVNGYDKIKGKFFDRDRYKQLLNIFTELVKIDLPDTYLLHGDFGRTNIFAEKTNITGVIDWSECMLGDFLWDLAWIAFWPEEIDYLTEYYKYNKDNELLDLSKYQDRFLLYTLVIGIHTMLIEGERDDEETYTEGVSRIKKYFPI